MEERSNRRAIELEEMKLEAVNGVLEDLPRLVEFRDVEVLDLVRNGCTWVLYLLVPVSEGIKDDRAV